MSTDFVADAVLRFSIMERRMMSFKSSINSMIRLEVKLVKNWLWEIILKRWNKLLSNLLNLRKFSKWSSNNKKIFCNNRSKCRMKLHRTQSIAPKLKVIWISMIMIITLKNLIKMKTVKRRTFWKRFKKLMMKKKISNQVNKQTNMKKSFKITNSNNNQ